MQTYCKTHRNAENDNGGNVASGNFCQRSWKERGHKAQLSRNRQGNSRCTQTKQ